MILKEITREDAEPITDHLKRDLSHANRYLAETSHELKTPLVESGVLHFHRISKAPSCPSCRGTTFHRQSS